MPTFKELSMPKMRKTITTALILAVLLWSAIGCKEKSKCDLQDCSFLRDYQNLHTSTLVKKNDGLSDVSVDIGHQKTKLALRLPVPFNRESESYEVLNDEYTKYIIPVLCQHCRAWIDPNTCAIREDKLDDFVKLFGELVAKLPKYKKTQPKEQLRTFLKTSADSIDKKRPTTADIDWQVNHLHRLLREVDATKTMSQTETDSIRKEAELYIHKKLLKNENLFF